MRFMMIDQDHTNIADIEAAAASFLDYGVGHIAYVRRIDAQDASGYGIFAANGVQIAIAANSADAYGFLMQHDLTPVVLH